MIETISIKAEFVVELRSKREWVNRIPYILPQKTRPGEELIWVDANGCVFESGADFEAAEKLGTYPCKVYRPVSVSSSKLGEKIETHLGHEKTDK